VFTSFGLALGPPGLGVLSLNVDKEGLRTLAELTLALVLFTDAANVNLGVLQVPAADMLRLRRNPFYPYIEMRVLEFLGFDGISNALTP